MTCREVMTPDPVCCLPSDTARHAAQLMAEHDVGPIPVVSHHHEKRLVGILTDRDIATKITAERGDPASTRVEDIMIRDLATVRADDDYQSAIRAMQRHQVRRVPVVDTDGLLIGIIAQADIARLGLETDTGELVEEISETRWQPFGGIFRRTTGGERNVPIGALLFVSGLALGIGAGLLFYLLNRKYGQPERRLTDIEAPETITADNQSYRGEYVR